MKPEEDIAASTHVSLPPCLFLPQVNGEQHWPVFVQPDIRTPQ
jgi:hypothetical protein